MAVFEEKVYEATYLPRIRELYREGGVDAFLRFGLDLEEDDTALIKARIAAVLTYWARKFNHPSDAGMYRILHADAETRKQLEDAEARQRLRLAVRDERAERERKRIRKLDRDIEIAAVDGFLTPEAVASLVATQVGQGFDESLIRKRIAHIPVNKPAAVKPLDPGLPDLTRKKIDTALAALKQPDLYTFLALPREATSAQWKEQYKAASQRASKQGTGPKVQAANTLLGIIKQHLLEDPEVYARTREYQLAQSLELNVRQLGVNGTISQRGYDRLLKEGLELGLAPDRCAVAIKWLAQKNSIAIATKSDATASAMSLCHECHGLIEGAEKLKECAHCKSDLWTKCPECTARVRVGDSCSQCAFPLVRKAYINGLLELGTRKILQNDLKEAASCLEELERVWMGGHVAKLRKKLETARDRNEGVYKDFRSALAKHEPLRAQGLLEQLRSVGSTYQFHDGSTFAAMESTVEVVMVDLEKTLKAARAALRSRETDKAVALFEEALHKASDSPEARMGLSQCVPDPPTSLRWPLSATSVTLEWQPSPSSGTLEYTVVARDDRAPKNPTDGTELSVTKDVCWEDTTLKPGATRFYSVFARRAAAISTPLSSTLVLGRFEVSSFALVSKDDSVEGSWEPLPDQARAIVTRTSVSAGRASKEIKCSARGFTDKTVAIGSDYEYRVAVEYTVAGRTNQTTGLVGRAQVDEKPEAVTDLQVARKTSTQVEVSWKNPARGKVEIFALTETPKFKNGASITPAELGRWNTFRVQTASNNALWTRPSGKARYFLTAVTVLGARAVVGATVLDLEGVSGLEGDYLETKIELRWVWPDGCDFVQVTWRYDTYPLEPDDPAAQKQPVNRGRYANARGFHLVNPVKENFYFTVFAGTAVDGLLRYGGGSSKGARVLVRGAKRIKISYKIRSSWMRFGDRTIGLSVSSDGSSVLPDLKLISRRNGPMPLRLEDGVSLIELRNKVSPHEVEVKMPEPGYLRLMLAKSAEGDKYQIIDPPSTQLDKTK